jgi:hypothetical protein
MYKSIDSLSKAIEEKRDILWKIKSEIHSAKRLTITYGGIDSSRASAKRDHYIFKCPSECRGFISNNYHCGTCKGIVCKKCRVQINKDSEHICNEDDIKSSFLVSSLTKPCPKCMTPILKSGGCDQMFCVLCHTAFSWTT